MHRLMIQYARPADPEKFESHYQDVHLPLVRTIPGLRRVVVSHPVGMRGDSAYLVVELWFDDKSAFTAALTSEQMAAASADAQQLATEATMSQGAVQVEEL